MGARLETKKTTKEIKIKFFIIYWPSKVGTNGPCQAIWGKRTRGIKVIPMWRTKKMNATRVALGIKNKTPISISNRENKIIKVWKDKNGKVFCCKSITKGLAGETSRIFNIPNQKYTTNNANRAKGAEIPFNKLITHASNFIICVFIFI